MSSNRIREFRQLKGWTQLELGRQLLVNQSYVSHTETGRQKVMPNLATELAAIFGVDPSDLFCGDDVPR